LACTDTNRRSDSAVRCGAATKTGRHYMALTILTAAPSEASRWGWFGADKVELSVALVNPPALGRGGDRARSAAPGGARARPVRPLRTSDLRRLDLGALGATERVRSWQ
jgi:hypothetical protein